MILPGQILPRTIGADVKVPLTTGGFVTYANLDYAATAPCLESVWIAVDEALSQYSSVHRGSGYLSRVTSELYERAREVVRDFVGAGPEHSVIFTRNTTDAMNLMAHALPAGTKVVVFESEHHAALLPWEREGLTVTRLPVPPTPMAPGSWSTRRSWHRTGRWTCSPGTWTIWPSPGTSSMPRSAPGSLSG